MLSCLSGNYGLYNCNIIIVLHAGEHLPFCSRLQSFTGEMICTLLHVSNPGIIQCIMHISRNWPMPTYVHLCMYPTRILHQSTACIGICSVIHVCATALAWYYIFGARVSIDTIQAFYYNLLLWSHSSDGHYTLKTSRMMRPSLYSSPALLL